jgi:hypothetical protein
MRHFDSVPVRQFFCAPVTALIAVSLGVASFAVFDAAPALASVNSHSRSMTKTELSTRVVAPGTWSSATEVPGTATLDAGNNAGIYSISCTSAGNCSAGGNYLDAAQHFQAFVVSESGGTWGTALEVPGTSTLNLGGNAVVWSVSCSSAGNCGAAGSYTDGSGNVQGFAVNEANGTWGNATEVIDPSAVGSPDALGAESISCSGTGSCVAVGDEIVAGDASVGFAVSESGGTWSDANEITISSSLGSGGTSLDNISCSSPGNCSAAGNGLYPDAAVSGGFAFIPFEVSETGGTWGSPSTFAGLATLNTGLNSASLSISCSSAGNCSAGGTYADGNGKLQAFVASETKGSWGDASEVPGTSSLNLGGAELTSLSCASDTNCSGSGFYTDASGNGQAFVVDESGGSWGNAVEVPGSSSLFVQGTGQNSNAISCSSAGNCSAGGVYFDSSGNAQAFVVTEKDGSWGDVIEVPGTGALNTAGNAFVSSISCSSDTSCGAGGWYSIGTNEFQAFATDMTPLFVAQATIQITSTHGTVGKALKLATSGGSGSGGVTFRVVNGSAKGCSITGTSLKATSAGTCSVTVTKAGDSTYLPASVTASITMALPAKPGKVTLAFAGASSALSGAARSKLNTLAKKLIAGASLVVTGFARGNAALARSRALAVHGYLAKKVSLHVTIKTDTATAANAVTVATTKQ